VDVRCQSVVTDRPSEVDTRDIEELKRAKATETDPNSQRYVMKNKMTLLTVLSMMVISLCAVAVTRGRSVSSAQQFPVLDAIANRIVQKYQGSTCEQLWQERAQKQNQPKTPEEQHAITMLQSNPQMRAEFISRVAAPIANKLFDCGMIP